MTEVRPDGSDNSFGSKLMMWIFPAVDRPGSEYAPDATKPHWDVLGQSRTEIVSQ